MALAGISGMLSSMKPLKRCLALLLGGLLVGGTVQMVLAEGSSNPYHTIIGRNAFRLKDPPPPQAPPPVVAPAPTVKVILTGITTIFGKTRALLEITEQEPGKTAATRKPVMREGESDGGVEVISINMEKGLVRIRSGGSETNISFDTPKLAGAAAAPAAFAGFSPPPPATTAAVAGVPTVLSPMNAAPDHPTRSSSVTVFGSSGSTAPTGGGGNSGAYGYGTPGRGLAASGPSVFGAAATTANEANGVAPIPPRTLRTDTSTPAAPSAPVDLAKQYLEMALDHEIQSAGGTKPYPPLPPMPTR
jgi:hypothetical protein